MSASQPKHALRSADRRMSGQGKASAPGHRNTGTRNNSEIILKSSQKDTSVQPAGEPLLRSLGSAGREGASVPESDVPKVDASAIFGDLYRAEGVDLPEVSEPEVTRHFVRLSQYNFAIDKGMYPLGSCTMKYNPKVNEWAARLPGFAGLHPLAPAEACQGALELMYRLERALSEICGMDETSLHPAAGAQGELTGLKMIRAYHRSQGRSPKKVLVPDTAHGTNSASCALSGFQAVPFAAGPDGIVRPEDIADLVDEDVAALMVTNPNTLGLFESHLLELAAMIHKVGGLVYGDGANLNALLGRVRPGDVGIDVMQFNLHKTFTTPHGGGGPGCGPVAYKALLAPFAPVPVVEKQEDGCFRLSEDRPHSIGRLRAFQGNFGMMVRAYAYIREMGAEHLKEVSEFAVLGANYLRVKLAERWHAPIDRICKHECIITDRSLKETGVTTLDVAKRLLDYGFHAPTIYFPLVVKGAMLVEPTETEPKAMLDRFAEVMSTIHDEAESDPEMVKTAPHSTPFSRVDETRAARQPKLRWG